MAFDEGMWTYHGEGLCGEGLVERAFVLHKGPLHKALSTKALSTKAHFLTGLLIGVFPHCTEGNSLQGGFFHLRARGSTLGPQHVPSHRTPEIMKC